MRTRRGSVLAPLLGILAFAFLVRIWHLDRFSLWLDEGATWWNATRETWQGTIFAETNLPPVWWVLTRVWIGLFGDGEFALRMPAALLGTIAVALTFFLARRLARDSSHADRVALLAAFLAATSGFLVEYSQEARMYSALLVETLALALLTLRWLEHGRRLDLVAFAVLATVALYTHVLAAWSILGLLVFVVLTVRGSDSPFRARNPEPFVIACAVAVLLFSPWIIRALEYGHGLSTSGRFNVAERGLYSLWRIGVGPAFAALDRTRIDAGVAAYLRDEGLWIAATALIVLGVLVQGIVRARSNPILLRFAAGMVAVPLVAMVLAQPVMPVMHEKYLIASAPALILLAAWGVASRPGRSAWILGIAFALVALVGLAAYHLPTAPGMAGLVVHGHPVGKEAWRTARGMVDEATAPMDPVALCPDYLQSVWSYYDRGRHPLVLLADSSAAVSGLRGRSAAIVLSHASSAEQAAVLRSISREMGVPAESLEARARLLPQSFGIRVVLPDPAARATP